MCEAGRILHHLRHNIGEPRNTILITGYQAENTLGRKLVSGAKEVRIFGLPAEVRAEIASLQELSGRADGGELLEWIRPAASRLKNVYLVHGEHEQSAALAENIGSAYGIDARSVRPGEIYDPIPETQDTVAAF